MGMEMFGVPVNVTESTVIKKLPGQVCGFYVNSTTGGTIIFYDAATAVTTTPVSGTITPVIGWHAFPASMRTGCYVVIANTLNVTIFTQ
jgi:hypothetical protein